MGNIQKEECPISFIWRRLREVRPVQKISRHQPRRPQRRKECFFINPAPLLGFIALLQVKYAPLGRDLYGKGIGKDNERFCKKNTGKYR